MAPSTQKANPSKTRKLRTLLIVVVALGLTAAAAAAFYLRSNRSATAAASLPADPIFIALEPLTVNLQPNGRNRFLHIGVTLRVADAQSQNQITQYLPEVRSRVLTVLSNRQSDSLLTPGDKTQLASEIMVALNQPFAPNLPPKKIASVMFTTFMLQ
jgi:flagellar protein FliL